MHFYLNLLQIGVWGCLEKEADAKLSIQYIKNKHFNNKKKLSCLYFEFLQTAIAMEATSKHKKSLTET